jgi:arsenite-transporting ATPase
MKESYSKFLFFTGKGGVGKTSLACSIAVKLADEGKMVLLISTDPASNLTDVLGCEVNEHINPHPLLPSLHTININPEVSADEYRKRVIETLMNKATEAEIQKTKENLSGACTTEIASFDEFSRFISGEGSTENYDVVIFDTAPTGHTLRLLELPAAWDNYLEENPSGASCIGPSSALKSSKARYKLVVDSLRNPALTTFYLVSRPEKSALKEAANTSLELIELGMSNQKLLINGVFKAIDEQDKFALKIQALAQENLSELPSALQTLSKETYPLLPYNILGLEKLRSVFNPQLQEKISLLEIESSVLLKPHLKNLKVFVDGIENSRKNGLIMCMGKGGVGKTIAAASIAVLLAERGHEVLLTTTDPAAHINDFISQLEHIPITLTIERIDPKTETQVYTDKIIAQKGAKLDEAAKNLLKEDLKSPCTEEVAVFHAFSKAIHKAKRQFVVIDTAPTGHTLLLLDTTGAYHKEVLKNTNLSVNKITTPYMQLQDPDFAKIILVALPETTPMREAEALQNDLMRAGIKPYAWLINQCLSEIEQISDPLLKKRAFSERAIIHNIEDKLSVKTFGIPYLCAEKMLPAVLSLNA